MLARPISDIEPATYRLRRERLVQRISQAAAYRAVLLIAGAGFGKSTALDDFLSTSGRPRIVIELAPDLTREDVLREFLDQAGSTPGGDQAERVRHLLRKWSGDIVLEDLHHAVDDPQLLDVIVALIEETGSNIRWFITARPDWRLPIGMLVAKHFADHPLDEGALAFTPADAAEYARQLGFEPRPENVERILSFTQGWPFATVLALKAHAHVAVDMQHLEFRVAAIAAPYFAHEVMRALAPDELQLLFAASVIPGEVRANLLQTVLRRDPSHDLHSLLRKVPLIIEVRPGRYVLAEILRRFIQHENLLVNRKEIYDRVASAYRDSGDVLAAIRVYVDAGEFDVALALVELNLNAWANGIWPAEIRSIVDDIPPGLRAKNASAILCDAISADRRGQYAVAMETARLAKSVAENDGDRVAAACVIAAASLRAGRRPEVAILRALVGIRLTRFAKARLHALLASALVLEGDLAGAREALNTAAAEMADDGVNVHQADIFFWMAYVMYRLGDYDASAALCRRITAAAEPSDAWAVSAYAHDLLSMIALNNGATIHVVMGHNSAAVSIARNCEDASEHVFLHRRCRFLFYTGEVGVAAFVAEQESTLKAGLYDSYWNLVRFLRHLEAGQAAAAIPSLKSLVENPVFSDDRIIPLACLALTAIVARDPSATNVIEELQMCRTDCATAIEDGTIHSTPLIERHMRIASVVEVLAGTLLGHSRGISESASILDRISGCVVTDTMAAIARAIVISIRAGSVLPLLRARFDELRDSMYGVFAMLLELAADQAAVAPAQPILSATELAILKDLHSGLKPKAIANERLCSEHTVRTHIKNIFRKLDVRSRLEAITRAQTLGVLP